MKMKKIIALLLLFGMSLSFCACGKKELNSSEQIASRKVEDLVDMMKDPDSFILRGDILRIKTDEWTYYYIDYSGNNSYGASIRSTAIYGTIYLGSLYGDCYYDSLETFISQFEEANDLYSEWLRGTLEGEATEISGKNIANYLGIEYRD